MPGRQSRSRIVVREWNEHLLTDIVDVIADGLHDVVLLGRGRSAILPVDGGEYLRKRGRLRSGPPQIVARSFTDTLLCPGRT